MHLKILGVAANFRTANDRREELVLESTHIRDDESQLSLVGLAKRTVLEDTIFPFGENAEAAPRNVTAIRRSRIGSSQVYTYFFCKSLCFRCLCIKQGE
jgi:hypothetical protein